MNDYSNKLPPGAKDIYKYMNKILDPTDGRRAIKVETERENEMFFSIILGCLIITTENAKAVIQLDEIVAYELVDNEDGGIVSFTLKGNHQETVYGCHNKASWKQVLKWFDDYEKEIIEGMTQAIKKESKKARF